MPMLSLFVILVFKMISITSQFSPKVKLVFEDIIDYSILMSNLSYFNELSNRLYFTIKELGYKYEIIDNRIDLVSYLHVFNKNDEYICYVLLDYESINFIQIGYDFSFPAEFSTFLMENMQEIYSFVSKFGCFMEFEILKTIDLSFCNKVYYSGFNYESFSDCLKGLLKLLDHLKKFFKTKHIELDMFTLIDDISLTDDDEDEDDKDEDEDDKDEDEDDKDEDEDDKDEDDANLDDIDNDSAEDKISTDFNIGNSDADNIKDTNEDDEDDEDDDNDVII